MSELLRAVKAALCGEPEKDGDDIWSARFVFEAFFPAFRGHFPGDPVLPAIVQLMAGACLAGAWLGRIPAITAVRNAKFTAPVRPGGVLTLSARPLPDGSGAECRARVGDVPAASFTIIFGDVHA